MPDASRLRSRQTYSNYAEQGFVDKAREHGWVITKRGWPDFFCVRPNGDVVVVEVKQTATQHLRREQLEVLRWLSSLGAKCYVSVDGALKSVDEYFERDQEFWQGWCDRH